MLWRALQGWVPVHSTPFRESGTCPPSISQYCTEVTFRRGAGGVFILLGKGKHALGPSVTVGCLSAVQDGIHTHPHTHNPCSEECENLHRLCDVPGNSPCQEWSLWIQQRTLCHFLECVIPLGAGLQGHTLLSECRDGSQAWNSPKSKTLFALTACKVGSWCSTKGRLLAESPSLDHIKGKCAHFSYLPLRSFLTLL